MRPVFLGVTPAPFGSLPFDILFSTSLPVLPVANDGKAIFFSLELNLSFICLSNFFSSPLNFLPRVLTHSSINSLHSRRTTRTKSSKIGLFSGNFTLALLTSIPHFFSL